MKRKPEIFCTVAIPAALLIFSGIVHEAGAQQQSRPALAEVGVESVELSEIGQDGLVAAIRISASARSSTTIRTLVFDNVAVNGVRVHVHPAVGSFKLRAGEPVENLPALQADLTYRELESLDPLRQAIRNGSASVHAEVHAQLELNLFQKIALLSNSAWVTVKVDQEVPVRIPGGPLGRVAAFGVLLAAEPVWIAGQKAQQWRRDRTDLAEDARASLSACLVSVESRYELKSRSGELVQLHSSQSGFLVGGGKAVVPAEAVEPWLFDDSVAEALEKGDVTVDESRLEILVSWPSDARTFSLQRHELRVTKVLRGEETAISLTTKRRYRVRFRNSDANAAMLEIPALRSAGTQAGLFSQVGPGEWQPAALGYFTPGARFPDGSTAGGPVPWLTEARFRNGRYEIKDPPNPSAYGSPLYLQGGIAGIVQDESSATEINGILRKLR